MAAPLSNNLKLNCSSRPRSSSDITDEGDTMHRHRCLKMLGVSIENNFSIDQHVKRLVTVSAQTVYIRVAYAIGLANWTTQQALPEASNIATDCSTSTVRPSSLVSPKRQTASASTLC